jgi:transcriptional regulator with XRE-family HTH domain
MPRSQHSDRYKQLRTRLFEQRKKAGATQEQLARRLGKPQSFISKYESGERRLDAIELLDVARALEVPIATLLRGL